MQTLAIIWNIPPAATTSSNYITSSVMSDTTCEAQTPEQYSYIQRYKLITELYVQFSWSQEEKEANSDEMKPKIREEPNAFIKLP